MTPRDLLLARAADGSTRGRRRDGHHLALVMEGGGMRGVISVGMAAAFQARGLSDAFDSVHGSSAGACGGAYFAARQAAIGASVYYENINNRMFIDFARFLAGKPIMDKDFLVDRVMQVEKPLAFDRLLAAPGFLHVVTTEVDTGRERIFSSFADRAHVFAALKATVCLPLIAGRPVVIGGTRLFDGGLVQQVAIRSAIDAGATHIVALVTRQMDPAYLQRRRSNRTLETWIVRLCHGRTMAARFSEHNDELDAMLHSGRAPDGALLDVLAIPPQARPLDRLSVDGAAIRATCTEAEAAAQRYLDRGSI